MRILMLQLTIDAHYIVVIINSHLTNHHVIILVTIPSHCHGHWPIIICAQRQFVQISSCNCGLNIDCVRALHPPIIDKPVDCFSCFIVPCASLSFISQLTVCVLGLICRDHFIETLTTVDPRQSISQRSSIFVAITGWYSPVAVSYGILCTLGCRWCCRSENRQGFNLTLIASIN